MRTALEAVAPMLASARVPDARKLQLNGNVRQQSYDQGWNACRAAMLAAAPKPEIDRACEDALKGGTGFLRNGERIDPDRVKLSETDRILWGIVANAGRLSTKERLRWAHVVDATGLGSHSSIELCRRFGFNPNEMVGGAP